MEFDMNMKTKDGVKMTYLISLGLKDSCKQPEAVWAELEKRMSAAEPPITRVDWLLFDNSGMPYDCSDHLFYAKTLEAGKEFINGVLEDRSIRSKLRSCLFYNGEGHKSPRRYRRENSLMNAKNSFLENNPGEKW